MRWLPLTAGPPWCVGEAAWDQSSPFFVPSAALGALATEPAHDRCVAFLKTLQNRVFAGFASRQRAIDQALAAQVRRSVLVLLGFACDHDGSVAANDYAVMSSPQQA
jgi:hypothetical protein